VKKWNLLKNCSLPSRTTFPNLLLKMIFPSVISRPDQYMAIDHRKSNRSIDNNRRKLVNCYRLLSANRWPIDNHKLESSNCYRLPMITVDYHHHRLLLTVICCQAVCLRSIIEFRSWPRTCLVTFAPSFAQITRLTCVRLFWLSSRVVVKGYHECPFSVEVGERWGSIGFCSNLSLSEWEQFHSSLFSVNNCNFAYTCIWYKVQ